MDTEAKELVTNNEMSPEPSIKRRREKCCSLPNLASSARQAAGTKRSIADANQVMEVHALSPADFVLSLCKENGFETSDTKSLTFLEPTQEMINAYTLNTVQIVRSEDIDSLRELHENGEILQCCNQFGESLIHLACRRGRCDIVRFLVREAHVSLLVKDDFGRTPLHDACWTTSPQFELVDFIIDEVPEFLCVEDVRGHTPFHYVRKEDWNQWMEFLDQRRSKFRPKFARST